MQIWDDLFQSTPIPSPPKGTHLGSIVMHLRQGNQTMTQISQTDAKKPRFVGINHIALEVGDIDQALDFYGKIFDFTLRDKRPGNAFIELGESVHQPDRNPDAARGSAPPFRPRRR